MNCPICNKFCPIVSSFGTPPINEYNCYQSNHQFWQQGNAWFIRDIGSGLLVNSYGISSGNSLQNYIIIFPTKQKPIQALPTFKQVLKNKAFL
jgi:hypothetical protein